jgi:protein-S-isoprenylcysteine O-methyltransferase Ste14
VILPTLPMLAVAVVNITLLNLKARNEERHLLASLGESYAQYVAATGRFLPRIRPAGTRQGE